MRISDWSSDVCSSDLAQAAHIRRRDILALTQRARLACQLLIVGVTRSVEHSAQLRIAHAADKARFEDQRLAAIFGDLAMQFFEQRARVLAIGDRKSTRLKSSH